MKPAIEAFKIGKYSKPSEALKKALDIIRRPGRWITGELAVGHDELGDQVVCNTKAGRKTAEAFCALGAVRFVNGPAQKSAEAFLREAGKIIYYEQKALSTPDRAGSDYDIFAVNDNYGLKPTIKMFKLAIKNARKAGK